MKKLIIILFLPAILFSMVSCSGDKVFEQAYVFPGAIWNRFEILSFDLPIKSTTNEYSIDVIIQINDQFEQNRIPVHFIMTLPSGEERIWEQTLTIRDHEGNLRGKRVGVFTEIEIPVRNRISFQETGNCNITAEQFIPKYETPGIVSFRLRLTRL